jgi:phosphoserine phosphatase
MSSKKMLVQFDVDSTFIQQEAIELLAAKAGVLSEVAQITKRAMLGEIDFTQSLKDRVRLLEGLHIKELEQVQKEVVLTDGAKELVDRLHVLGHSVALVSGGFLQILAPIVSNLSIQYFRANLLEIEGDHLTGRLVGPIIDKAAKATALREFAEASGVDMANTVAIGDGANDLEMMALAGLSIAFNAKPVVVAAADLSIDEPSLRAVAALIGLK